MARIRELADRQKQQNFTEELEVLRGALARSVQMYGLRKTAREVSMSPAGLSRLVEGGQVYSQTLRKLRAWRATWELHHGSPDEAAETAMRVLLEGVRPDRRSDAAGRLREVLASFEAPK